MADASHPCFFALAAIKKVLTHTLLKHPSAFQFIPIPGLLARRARWTRTPVGAQRRLRQYLFFRYFLKIRTPHGELHPPKRVTGPLGRSREVLMTFRTRNTFHLALGAALASRRTMLLRHLPSRHGHRRSAMVIATWPIRQIADMLSRMPRAEQVDIFLRLPLGTRTRLTQVAIPSLESAATPRRASTFDVLRKWLLPGWSTRGHFIGWSRHKNHAGFPTPQTSAISVKK